MRRATAATAPTRAATSTRNRSPSGDRKRKRLPHPAGSNRAGSLVHRPGQRDGDDHRAGGTVSVSVDGGPFTPASGPVTLSGDGAHIVSARDSAGDTVTAAYLIDTHGPVITHSISPAAPGRDERLVPDGAHGQLRVHGQRLGGQDLRHQRRPGHADDAFLEREPAERERDARRTTPTTRAAPTRSRGSRSIRPVRRAERSRRRRGTTRPAPSPSR